MATAPESFSRTAPAVASKAEPAGPRYGVVAVGSTIYTATDGLPAFQIPPPEDEFEPIAGVLVRIIDLPERGRVAIEFPPEDTRAGCAPLMHAIAPYGLRAYVDRDAFVPLTAEQTRHEFANGTSIELSAGVPVLEGTGPHRMAIAEGLPLKIPAAGTKTDLTYVPATFFDDKNSLAELGRNRWWPEMKYGDGEVIEQHQWRQMYWGKNVMPLYYEAVARGRHALITVRNRCLEARVEMKAKWPEAAQAALQADVDPDRKPGDPWGADKLPSIYSAYRSYQEDYMDSRWVVRAGDPVYWPDGTLAGTIAVEQLEFKRAPQTRGLMMCADVPLTAYPDPSVDLCFVTAVDLRAQKREGPVGLGNSGLIK